MIDDPRKGVVNITSYNQTGGITAHTVNMGKQPYKFGESQINELRNAWRNVGRIELTFYGEAGRRAAQLVAQTAAADGKEVEIVHSVLNDDPIMPREPFLWKEQGGAVHVYINGHMF